MIEPNSRLAVKARSSCYFDIGVTLRFMFSKYVRFDQARWQSIQTQDKTRCEIQHAEHANFLELNAKKSNNANVSKSKSHMHWTSQSGKNSQENALMQKRGIFWWNEPTFLIRCHKLAKHISQLAFQCRHDYVFWDFTWNKFSSGFTAFYLRPKICLFSWYVVQTECMFPALRTSFSNFLSLFIFWFLSCYV